MTTAAWWHCFSGIAGDMALASLVDAGADIDEVVAGLRRLPVDGWQLRAERTTKSGLAATRLNIEVDNAQAGTARPWSAVRQIVEDATGLADRVRQRSLTVFTGLAAAEARLHDVAVDDVHFHEVGGVDAILDIVGTCLALEALDVDEVHSSPVALGTGTVRSQHGLLPNPAPAVVELLAGAPVYGTPHGLELTTPTGAALLAGLAVSFGPLPPMTVTASGYGAGTADLPGVANVVQVVIGDLEPLAPVPVGRYEDLVVVETNVDDVTGEVLAHTVASLLGAGAVDAWLAPIVAKKGRPGHVVCALCPPLLVADLTRVLAAETGTLGVRHHTVQRWAATRRIVSVEVEGVPVRVKAGPYRAKAEYDDCARAAVELGLPMAEVARRAESAAAGRLLAPVE
jgi:hypothetical protein